MASDLRDERCAPSVHLADLPPAVAVRPPPPAPHAGTKPEKIRLQKWYTVFKDHITLEDYEIHDSMNLEMYYN